MPLTSGYLLSGPDTRTAIRTATGERPEHLGTGDWGEAWRLSSGQVLKITGSPAERDCVTRLIAVGDKVQHVPRLFASGPASRTMRWAEPPDDWSVMSAPLFWYLREEVDELPRQQAYLAFKLIELFEKNDPELRNRTIDAWRERISSGQLAEALELAGKVLAAARQLTSQAGVQLLDHRRADNWGVTSDGRLVFRDLACNTGPGGWKPGVQDERDPRAVWPPAAWPGVVLPDTAGGPQYEQIYDRLAYKVRTRRHPVDPVSCDEPWTDPQLLDIERHLNLPGAQYRQVQRKHLQSPDEAARLLLGKLHPSLHRWAASVAVDMATRIVLPHYAEDVNQWFESFLSDFRESLGRIDRRPWRPTPEVPGYLPPDIGDSVQHSRPLRLLIGALRGLESGVVVRNDPLYQTVLIGASAAVADDRTDLHARKMADGTWFRSGYSEIDMLARREQLAFLRRWWCEIRRRFAADRPESADVSGPERQPGIADYARLQQHLVAPVPQRHDTAPIDECDAPWTSAAGREAERILALPHKRYMRLPWTVRLASTPANVLRELFAGLPQGLHRPAALIALEQAAVRLLPRTDPAHAWWFESRIQSLREAVAARPVDWTWSMLDDPPWRDGVYTGRVIEPSLLIALRSFSASSVNYQRAVANAAGATAEVVSGVRPTHESGHGMLREDDPQSPWFPQTEAQLEARREEMRFLRRWWCTVQRRFPIDRLDTAEVSGAGTARIGLVPPTGSTR